MVVFYASHDGGQTWQTTTPIQSHTSSHFVYDFVDSEHGWISDGATISVTRDGGQTWHLEAPQIPFQGVTQIDFATRQTGWMLVAVGESKVPELLITTDGGGTWQAAETEIPPSSNLSTHVWATNRQWKPMFGFPREREPANSETLFPPGGVSLSGDIGMFLRKRLRPPRGPASLSMV